MTMTVHHYTNTGRFYLGRADQQQQVVLVTPWGSVSQLWDEGEAPYDADMDAGEVLDIIAERLESYWINTSRNEDRAKIARIREHIDEANRLWHEGRARVLQAEIARLSAQARRHAAECVAEA